MKLTTYKIKRDYSNAPGFFLVRGHGCGWPDCARHRHACGFGVGFQLKVGAYVYGCSIVLWEPKS